MGLDLCFRAGNNSTPVVTELTGGFAADAFSVSNAFQAKRLAAFVHSELKIDLYEDQTNQEVLFTAAKLAAVEYGPKVANFDISEWEWAQYQKAFADYGNAGYSMVAWY